MRIRLERDVLAEAVQWAARSLPTRPSVPILAGLMIRAADGQVVLSSFDYETSAQVTVKADVTDDGVALVSGRLLAEIARSLPNKPVELTSDATKVELVCGTARFTLQTLPVSDYPALPSMPEATGAITSEDFAKAVGQVVVAAGRDELLPVFTGVRMEIDGDTLSLLATDRYRMALKELPWNPRSTGDQGSALVPARVLSETARSMTSGQHVTLSDLGLQPVADVGQLDRNVQQDRAHHDKGQAVVDRKEIPPERVPAEDVEEAGEQLHQCGRDQDRHCDPLHDALH